MDFQIKKTSDRGGINAWFNQAMKNMVRINLLKVQVHLRDKKNRLTTVLCKREGKLIANDFLV